jgi:DNA helicase-2/ATP-dependent DNA helicase PcrA
MLNREQAAAARGDIGFSLILAGAGTGKTTTLIEKVSEVIRRGIAPSGKILLLTFSRAAAEEMRQRIAKKIPEAEALTAGTFHSAALSILRSFPSEWAAMRGFSAYPSILDEESRKRILFGLARNRLDDFLGLPLETIVWLCSPINRDKGCLHKGFEFIRDALDSLLNAYEHHKAASASADFNDLISDCTRLLRDNPPLRQKINGSFRYIFIDEFQDITDETLAFVKLLLPEEGGNLCAVGDDAQAIYSFMGSSPRHICSFEQVFPGARHYRLTENYRSRSEIISLSNAVIQRNVSGIRKNLHAIRGKGGSVTFHAVSAEDEHLCIQQLIEQRAPGSLAVLFRNNWQILRLKLFLGTAFTDGKQDVVFETIHASKGLEYDTVILAGVEDGIFPGCCSDIEEERRLLYVALTRSRDHLCIVYRQNGDDNAVFADECLIAQAGWRTERLYLDRTLRAVSRFKKRIGM